MASAIRTVDTEGKIMPLIQGDIYLVNFENLEGTKNKVRPAIILSRNSINTFVDTVVVVPLSGYKGKKIRNAVLLEPNDINNINTRTNVIFIGTTSVSNDRIIKKIGSTTEEEKSLIMNGFSEVFGFRNDKGKSRLQVI